jgi:hypothetical protein
MSKLEKIKEHGDCELTRQLAMSNMCDKLKSVELTFVPAISPTSGEILAELKNMPVLETLKLRHFRIKIMDLETVHYNVPSIKSLCLGNTILASGEFPTDIISATLITKLDLHLSRADDIHTHIQFYKYVGKKYASVNNPSFQDGAGPREGLNHVRQVYNEGILPLYQNIGPHTDSFSFNHYCDDLDAFRKFDDFGMKLKELTIVVRFNHGFLFLEKLVQSQQSKYIQTLISKGAVPAPLDMMINMEVLKTLEISCKNNYCFRGGRAHRTVNLSQLVESCPETLTHLTIEAVNLTFNESTSNPTSIQYLKLADVVIKSPTTITGASFPELSILHLKPIVTSQFTMSLPKNHLKEVTIHVKYPNDEEGGPSVKIINKDEPHRKVIWSTCNSDIGGMIDEHFKPTSVSEETQMVYFTCGSAKDLSYSTI